MGSGEFGVPSRTVFRGIAYGVRTDRGVLNLLPPHELTSKNLSSAVPFAVRFPYFHSMQIGALQLS
jgi:hypothetical protein